MTFNGSILINYLTRGPMPLSCGNPCSNDGPADIGRIFGVKKKIYNSEFIKCRVKWIYRTFSVWVAALDTSFVELPYETLLFWESTLFIKSCCLATCSCKFCIALSLSSNCPWRNITCLRKSVNSSAIFSAPFDNKPLESVLSSFRLWKRPFCWKNFY